MGIQPGEMQVQWEGSGVAGSGGCDREEEMAEGQGPQG